MNSLSKFFLLLTLAFLVPTTFLVLVPAIRTSKLTPVAYDKEADGRVGAYPQMPANTRGLAVYRKEGCVYCHTQVIRTDVAGLDVWKKGWGADQSDRPEKATRPSTQWDYLGMNDAMLGYMRNGPDLANEGYRIEDPMRIHMLLYNPRGASQASNMPSFRHLYTLRKIEGQKADTALPLEGKMAPPDGMEVIPSEEAVALVEYLQSLKRDTPLPTALKDRMTLND